MKLRALDLFCGAGGVTKGLQRAGFHVTGVDLVASPRYCGDEFIQANALTVPLDGYDFIWASPPCQRYARIGAVHDVRESYPDLIPATLARLGARSVPWAIENVPESKLSGGMLLCGSMFRLGSRGGDGVYRQLRRHRVFTWSGFLLGAPMRCAHEGQPIGVYGDGGPQRASRNRGYMGGSRERQEAMGIDWMRTRELSQAIPPAYAEFIGRAALDAIRRAA